MIKKILIIGIVICIAGVVFLFTGLTMTMSIIEGPSDSFTTLSDPLDFWPHFINIGYLLIIIGAVVSIVGADLKGRKKES